MENYPKQIRRRTKILKRKLIAELGDSDLIIRINFTNIRINPSELKNIKRFFLKSVPSRCKKIMEYDREILFPLNYSYIKHPISITDPKTRKTIRLSNTAAGMIIEYEYLGLYKHWGTTIKQVKKIVRKMIYSDTNYSKAISKIKYSIGFQI